MLNDRLALVHQRIQGACRRCGRDPSSVTLVGVTKGVAVEALQEAIAFGLTDLGENRVQEASRKYQELVHSPQSTVHSVRWHLIGHLQRNKAKDAVEMFNVIHSVDSIHLADELERQLSKDAQGSRLEAQGSSLQPRASSLEPFEVFIQVNLSGETTQFGCAPDEVLPLARAVVPLAHLRLVGLMTMAPYAENPEESRPYFRRLRQLRDALGSELRTPNSGLKLSMGMSQDFEVAIEEGADFIRVGTALFGERKRERPGT